MLLPNLPFFTVLVPVEAEAFPLEGEPYYTWLQPGTYYSLQELTTETLVAGRLDAVPELYFLCLDESTPWSYFVSTAEPGPPPVTALCLN